MRRDGKGQKEDEAAAGPSSFLIFFCTVPCPLLGLPAGVFSSGLADRR